MKSISKPEFIADLAERHGVSKKDAAALLESLQALVVGQLKENGGVVIPGIVKLVVKEKPAQPERQGKNPFTGAAVTIKAKPASKAVKASVAKQLKDAV